MLQVLYKFKTAKLFEKPTENQEEDPYAIQIIHLDAESRLLAIAGYTHVMVFKYSKVEATVDVPVRTVAYSKKLGGIRYEARSRGRSSPNSLAF